METGESTTDIISAARRFPMFEAGEKVLVAVSGGPDSVAMLYALHTRSAELGISLHIAHLNHGIRGEASDLDAEFVRDFARTLGLPCTIERADVPAASRQMKLGLEEAARKLRYEFLERTADTIGADKIAVGHNADDRVESLLMNVLRGAGIDGLGSIRPVRGRIVRPLISTWRAGIEAYIAGNALPFRVDESNADTSYTRNRIRHELTPLLERDYNPQAREALLRLAEVAAEQSELVDLLTESALHSCVRGSGLDTGLLAQQRPALLKQIIRTELEAVKGDLTDVELQQIERVAESIRSGLDFIITLTTGQLYASSKSGIFRIHGGEAIRRAHFDHPVSIPGATAIPEVSVLISAAVEECQGPRRVPSNEALIDADAISGALRARSVQPGDRIVPFGMTGSKKLQDVFVDRKIPRRDRARAIVVCDDEKIVWVVGVVSSELVRVTEATKTEIRLVAEPDL